MAVVWLGRDDNKPTGLTGASGALQIWSALMKQITIQPVDLSRPDNIEMVWIDPETGLLANEFCQNARQFPYISGSAPEQEAACVETTGNRTKTWFNEIFESFD